MESSGWEWTCQTTVLRGYTARLRERQGSAERLAGRRGAPAHESQSVIYRFGEFALDDERLELRRGNRVVQVQPKVLDLLLHLIREREHVVSRRELLDHLWGDAAVVEGVLTTAIHEARVALGDNASRQWAVKTVPRRGYRFVARIEDTTTTFRRTASMPPSGCCTSNVKLSGRPTGRGLGCCPETMKQIGRQDQKDRRCGKSRNVASGRDRPCAVAETVEQLDYYPEPHPITRRSGTWEDVEEEAPEAEQHEAGIDDDEGGQCEARGELVEELSRREQLVELGVVLLGGVRDLGEHERKKGGSDSGVHGPPRGPRAAALYQALSCRAR